MIIALSFLMLPYLGKLPCQQEKLHFTKANYFFGSCLFWNWYVAYLRKTCFVNGIYLVQETVRYFCEIMFCLISLRNTSLTLEMFSAIYYHLYNLKNVKITHEGVLLFLIFQAEVSNFLKVTFLHLCFFTFLKLS